MFPLKNLKPALVCPYCILKLLSQGAYLYDFLNSLSACSYGKGACRGSVCFPQQAEYKCLLKTKKVLQKKQLFWESAKRWGKRKAKVCSRPVKMLSLSWFCGKFIQCSMSLQFTTLISTIFLVVKIFVFGGEKCTKVGIIHFIRIHTGIEKSMERKSYGDVWMRFMTLSLLFSHNMFCNWRAFLC